MVEIYIAVVVMILLYIFGHILLPDPPKDGTWGNTPKEEE
jgi:hypothetical protein